MVASHRRADPNEGCIHNSGGGVALAPVAPAWAAGQWTESDAHGMQDNRRLTGTHLLSAEVVQGLPVAGVVRCVLQVGPRTGPAGDTTVIG